MLMIAHHFGVLMEYILIPLISGFVGYITNWVAIKMLFYPLEEKKFLGIKVPFTPGLIPREREKLIEAVVQVISNHLFTKEKLKELFYKSEIQKTLEKNIDAAVDKLVDEFLQDLKESIISGLSLSKINLKMAFITTVLEKVIDKSFESAKEKLKMKIKERIKRQLEEDINIFIDEVIDSLDIENLVRETLNQLDIKELERLILLTSERYLRYITYLGGFIGLIVGIFQDFVIFFYTGR